MKNINLKMLKILTIVILSLVYCETYSQVTKNPGLWRTYSNPAPGVTFEDLQESFKTYWKDREYQKGKGYKQFLRWENEYKPRVYPSGDMTLPSTTYENYMAWMETNQSQRQRRSVGPAWEELGPHGRVTGFDSGNGRVNMLRVHPTDTNILFVGAPDGGLWKSTTGGNTWSTNNDFLAAIGASDLLIHPTTPNTMYLGTGDLESDRRSIGVLKTTDGGLTWNPTSLTWPATDNQKIMKMLMDPNDPDIMLVASNNGVFRTTDGWDSWTSAAPFVKIQDLEFKPGNSNVVYASTESKFYKSTNGGVSFTQTTTGLPTSNVVRMLIAVSPDNANVVYAFCGAESHNGFLGMYRSTNSGASFVERSTTPNLLGYVVNGLDTGGQADYDMALTVSPTDANFVTVGGVNQWQSSDGGANWYMISHWFGEGGNPYVHADVHEIVHLVENPTTMFTSCDGGIYRSYDEGATWHDISGNLAIAQVNVVGHSATIEDLMFCGLQDIGTIQTDDATIPDSAWHISAGGGGDGEDCFIDRTDNDYVVVSGVNGAHELSTDGGVTFNPISGGATGLPAGAFISIIRQDPVEVDRYYAGGRTKLYRTNNNGTNWTALGQPFGANVFTEFAIAPSSNTTIYATSGIDLAKSTNGGSSFTDITGTLPVDVASITKIAVSNTNANKVWVTFSGYADGEKVYKSTNGGATWTNISAGLPNIPFNTIVFEDNSAADNIYVGGDIGVYFINNVTPSWIPHSNGLANAQIKDLRIFYNSTPHKLRAATYGRGTWQVDVITAPCNTTISEICTPGPCLFASGLYQAQNTITYDGVSGDYVIRNENNVILSAGTGIELVKNFGVELGSAFEINSTGCTP